MTLLLLEGEPPGPEGPRGQADVAARGDVAERPEQVLCCAACGHAVTTPRARIRVQGAHEHTQMNPHGHFYRVGCFSEAPGCGAAGAPTAHWTWFSGYAWRVAHCGACREHLGWSFQRVGELFWGLILDRLAQIEGHSPPG